MCTGKRENPRASEQSHGSQKHACSGLPHSFPPVIFYSDKTSEWQAALQLLDLSVGKMGFSMVSRKPVVLATFRLLQGAKNRQWLVDVFGQVCIRTQLKNMRVTHSRFDLSPEDR